jgi:hypothetical protein
MNACGQHNMSAIFFRESINAGKLVASTSSTLGWWNLETAQDVSDKAIKIPSRGPDAALYFK